MESSRNASDDEGEAIRLLFEDEIRDLSFLPPVMGQEPNLPNAGIVEAVHVQQDMNQEPPHEGIVEDDEGEAIRLLFEDEIHDLSFLPPVMGQEPNLPNAGIVEAVHVQQDMNQEPPREGIVEDHYIEEIHEEVAGLLAIEDDIQPDIMIQEPPHENLRIEEMIRADNARKLMRFVPTPVNVNVELPCIFTTILTISQLDRFSLNLPKNTVRLMQELMPHADFTTKVKVDMFDKDKGEVYPMSFDVKGGRHVLTTNWKKEFVLKRKLTEGEEIGIYWDNSRQRLQFSVLSRPPGYETP